MALLDRFRNKEKTAEQDPAEYKFDSEEPQIEGQEQLTPQEQEGDFEHEPTSEEIDHQAEEVAEQMLSEKEQIEQLIEEHFAEEFEKVRSLDENGDEMVATLKAELLEKIQGSPSKSRLKSIISHVATKFTLPALAGAGLRSVAKSSARVYFGWSTLGASIGLGALIGGGAAAIETYIKEREKVNSNDVLRQLDEAMGEGDQVKLAEIIDVARKQIKKGKLLPLEVNEMKVRLQKAEMQLRLKLKEEVLEEFTEAERFLWVAKKSMESRSSLRGLEEIKHQKLEEKIKFEMQANPEFKKKLIQNIAIGTAAGMLGGAAGYGMHAVMDSEYVRSVFGWEPGQKSSEKVAEKAITETGKVLKVDPVTAEQVTNNVGQLQHETLTSHSKELIAQAQRELLQEKFSVAAEKGEGATHAARDLIHDYIINAENLGDKPRMSLTPEQLAKLVYAEDSLMKEHFLGQTAGVEHIVQPGQKFELTGAQIQAALDKADKLTPEQLASMSKMLNTPGHQLSEQTQEWLKKDQLDNGENSFWNKIADKIQQSAEKNSLPVDSIAVDAQQEAARAATEHAAGETLTSAEKAKADESGASWKTAALVISALAIASVSSAMAWKKFRQGKEAPLEEETATAEESEQEDNAVEESPLGSGMGMEDGEVENVTEAEPEVKLEVSGQELDDFNAELKAQYNAEVKFTKHEIFNQAGLYLAALPKLIAKYPEFFDGKNLYLDDGEHGDRKFYDNTLILDINSLSLEDNLDWLADVAGSKEADAGERTITLPRLDKTTVELVQETQSESKSFFGKNKVEIHGHPFNDQELSIADLELAGLAPVYDIKMPGAEIKVSKPYRLSEKRIAVTAYVKENDEYVARSYYRSNSAGLWRYLPGYLPSEGGGINWYDKAMSEEAITVPSEVQQALAHLSKEEADILTIDNPNFYFAGTARNLYEAAVNKENRTIVLEVQGESDTVPGLDNRYKEGLADPETVDINDVAFKPNFENKVATWSQASNVYTSPGQKKGNVEVELFESNNGQLRYMFCKDELGRAWLAAIETTGPVKSTGLREKWIRGGDITTPAYEYDSQADKYGNDALRNGHYVDMFENYVSKLPLVKEYLAKSNSASAVDQGTAEVKFTEPADAKQVESLEEQQPAPGKGIEKAPEVQPEPEEAEKQFNWGEALNLSAEEINQEGQGKKLSAGRMRVWFDLMRTEKGLIYSAIGEGRAFSADEAALIQNSLRNMADFGSNPKATVEIKKVEPLIPAYEILLKKYAELPRGSREWEDVNKVVGNMRKLNPNLMKRAENAALERLKLSRSEIGLN